MIDSHSAEQMLERTPPDRLRKLIVPATDEALAAAALKVLTHTRPAEAAELAANVLAHTRFGPSVRSVAAIELGKVAGFENESALIKAMRSSEPQVLRHILKSIGRIGGEKALDRLAKLETPVANPVAEALSFARVLLSYRLGSARFLVRPPVISELRPPAQESATSLSVRKLNAKQIEPILASVRRQLPATDLSLRSGLAVTCASEYRVLLSDKADEGIAASLGRPFIAGAIFKYRPCPEHFSLDAYLLSSPEEAGSSHIFAMRPSGLMVIAGTARVIEGNVVFAAATTRTTHFRRLRVTGELTDGGAFRSVEALVSRELADDGLRSQPLERRANSSATSYLGNV
jgi:hypothetical protein